MRSWKFGRAFGIDLFVHWTFLLAPALAYYWSPHHGPAALLDVAVVLVLFGCVLLHELGHALAARGFGIGTRDITLYPIGGVARLEGMGNHPGQEVVIAVAGPLVNVVIAAGLWFGMSLAHMATSTDILQYGSLSEQFLFKVLVANIGLVVFNMIPAFPMDGGRVLRALLAIGFGQVRATEIAVGLAKVFAVLFLLAGLMGNISLALIGVMLVIAGRQELAMVRAVEARGYNGYAFDPERGLWVLWRDGRPVAAYSGRPM